MTCQCGLDMQPNPRVAGIAECPHCDLQTCKVGTDSCRRCINMGIADGNGPKTRYGRR